MAETIGRAFVGLVFIAVIWFAVTVVSALGDGVDSVLHPTEHARRIAQAQAKEVGDEAEAAKEDKAKAIADAAVQADKDAHDKRVADCMGGPGAMNPPAALYEQMLNRCDSGGWHHEEAGGIFVPADSDAGGSATPSPQAAEPAPSAPVVVEPAAAAPASISTTPTASSEPTPSPPIG